MKNVIFLKRRINIKFPSLCFSIYHQSHFSLSSQSNSIKRAVKDSCLCIFFFFLTSHLFSTSAMRSGNEWLSRTSQTSIASPPTPWRTLRRLIWQNDSSFLIALPYSLPSPPSPRLLQWRWIREFSSPLSFPVPNSLPSDSPTPDLSMAIFLGMPPKLTSLTPTALLTCPVAHQPSPARILWARSNLKDLHWIQMFSCTVWVSEGCCNQLPWTGWL